MRALIVLSFLGLLPLTSDADCIVRRRVVVRDAVVVKEVVQAAVVAQFVPVAVPAYYAGYQPGANQAELEALRKEVAELRAALQQGGAITPSKPAPQGSGGVHQAVAIMRAKCASCHDARVAKEKGHGFELFDGKDLKALSGEKLLAIVRETYSGRMPKNGKLSDEDVAQIMDFVDKQK